VFAELSSDGNTLAIGALLESSQETGINGNQNESPIAASGAVYLYGLKLLVFGYGCTTRDTDRDTDSGQSN